MRLATGATRVSLALTRKLAAHHGEGTTDRQQRLVKKRKGLHVDRKNDLVAPGCCRKFQRGPRQGGAPRHVLLTHVHIVRRRLPGRTHGHASVCSDLLRLRRRLRSDGKANGKAHRAGHRNDACTNGGMHSRLRNLRDGM